MFKQIYEKTIKPIDNNKGAVLVFTLLLFMVMAIIGTTMVASSARNQKSAHVTSHSESAYYIAEAGIHYMVDQITKAVEAYKDNDEEFDTDDKFFDEFYDAYNNKVEVLNNFDENKGRQPTARITVSRTNTGDISNDYIIKSVGTIGDNTRTVSSLITIGWSRSAPIVIPPELPTIPESFDKVFVYGSKFAFPGNNINGPEGTVVSGSLYTHDLNGGTALNVSNMFFNGPVVIDGGSASFGSQTNPGTIHVNGTLDLWNGSREVYGDVIVKGKFRLKDAHMHGNVYVNGDLELGWTPTIYKSIYYTGKIIAPDSYNQSLLNKCIKVNPSYIPSFTVPEFNVQLKDNSWYNTNGYEIKTGDYSESNFYLTNSRNKNKIIVDGNYTNSGQKKPNHHVVIISKNGNITIKGGTNDSQANNFVTGVLIAPNGKVNLKGWSFNGIIISKDGVYSTGWTVINMGKLSDFFATEDQIPFAVIDNTPPISGSEPGSGENPGSGGIPGEGTIIPGTVTAGVSIKSPIKEVATN